MRTTSPTGVLRVLVRARDQPQPGRLAAPAWLRRHGRRLAPRYRRQRPRGRAAVLPARGHQPHPADALHRAHNIHAAADRPPAVAGLLHEGEALQPARLADRRRVAAEAPAVELETEQLQPVAQAHETDEIAAPGVLGPLASEPALQAP